MKDFELSSQRPLSSDSVLQQLHAPQSSAVSGGSHSVEDNSATNSATIKKKHKQKSHRKTFGSNLPQSSIQPLINVPPASEGDSHPVEKKAAEKNQKGKKGKFKHQEEIRAKRLQRERTRLPIGGSFRQIVMKLSGQQKFITGSKVWMAKRSKRKRNESNCSR